MPQQEPVQHTPPMTRKDVVGLAVGIVVLVTFAVVALVAAKHEHSFERVALISAAIPLTVAAIGQIGAGLTEVAQRRKRASQ